jgi:heparanase 1
MKIKYTQTFAVQTFLVLAASAHLAIAQGGSPSSINPTTMPRIGSVDERFQSYNIEMVEVTGGRFWKPYVSKAETAPPSQASANQPVGMDPNLYQYRPPIDLSNARLRKLAAALGPAYLRVSGTWANTTYFQATDGPAPVTPPAGFKGVLTAAEWKGVIDFSHAATAELVTSFATGAGTRDASGAWTTEEAQKLLSFTKSAGSHIAAAEYMNEPTFAEIGGAPKGYDAAAFARDFAIFRTFARQAEPGMILLGPGGVGEGSQLVPASMHLLSSEDILKATGPVFDAFSYHSYGAVSSRCMPPGASGTPEAVALSEEWLGRPDHIEQFYSALRDRFEPGKAIWLTETAEAACGGDRLASTFLDSFRYLNQLGDLAKRGVKVQMHNTLASSDYGLLDENTYLPRPNYWAALLWRNLMGVAVLDAGPSASPNLHLYAHCLRNHPGGVALLAINADRTAAQTLTLPIAAERYSLTAPDLMGTHVQLNGNELELGGDDALPSLKGLVEKPGTVTLAPASITFLAFPKAVNASCK